MGATDDDLSCPVGYKHPRHVRDVALQVWGFRCSRDFPCTHKALTAQVADMGVPCVPDVRTLRQWARDDDWSREIARMMRSIAPDVVDSMVTDLLFAASEGVPWLRDVLAGRVHRPDSTRVRSILAVVSLAGIGDSMRAVVRGHADAASSLPENDVTTPALVAGDSMHPDMGGFKDRIAHKLGLDGASDDA